MPGEYGLPDHPYTDADVQRAARETPLAGGETFEPEWTEDDVDVIVSEPSEWDRADQNDVVYLADDERIDVTGRETFDLEGTVVCGGRHKSDPNSDEGVEAGLIVDTEGGPGSVSYGGIFEARYEAGHLQGIRVRGPSWYPERAGRYQQEAPLDARCWPGYTHIRKEGTTLRERTRMRDAISSRGLTSYADGTTVRNCDIHGFTNAGVSSGARNIVPENVEVTHSALHNCAIPGLGYPLNVVNGEVLSKYNYYNAYRRAITGFGYGSVGYTSRYDVFGPDALLAPVDMHAINENGGADDDSTAGKYVHVDRSTFLAYKRFETPGWYSYSKCPAVVVRGEPTEGIYVTNSQFLHQDRDEACDQRNVGGLDDWWSFDNNEFERENWTPENGAGVAFGSGESDGSSETPTVEYDYDPIEARRARGRTVADHLGELQAALAD